MIYNVTVLNMALVSGRRSKKQQGAGSNVAILLLLVSFRSIFNIMHFTRATLGNFHKLANAYARN